MEMVSVAHLDRLKNLVREMVKMKISTQGDCAHVQLQIASTTGAFISEIALQRLFGFTPAKFQPSLHTLDTLSRFCEYDSWQMFCSKDDYI